MPQHNIEQTEMLDRRALAQKAADELARDCPGHADVERGSMFGSEGLKVGGKFFAFVNHDGELTLKLPATLAATLIARGEATPLQAWSPHHAGVGGPACVARRGRWPLA